MALQGGCTGVLRVALAGKESHNPDMDAKTDAASRAPYDLIPAQWI
jgi:hypothetical protein